MKVAIAGAGPAGLFLAANLMRRPGYEVHVFDSRPDPRDLFPDDVRSYPVQLQARGLEALRRIPGLEKRIEQDGMFPSGVAFHFGSRATKIPLPPTKLFVDHSRMTHTLLQTALEENEKNSDSTLEMHFGCSVTGIDLDEQVVNFRSLHDEQSEKASIAMTFDQVVAADGGHSQIRQLLVRMGKMTVEQKAIPDRHRLLRLSRASTDGSVQLDPKCMHGWVLDKGRVKIIAAPLLERDACSAAFVFDFQAFGDQDPLETLQTPQEVKDYFQELAPKSLAKLVTDKEVADLLKRPTSSMVTVKCDRLHADDCVVLLGDAAHAMSQSVGQGCIAALQDVSVLCNLLEKSGDNWKDTLTKYTEIRLLDAQALFELSDYAKPKTKWMNVEWGLRQLMRKALPSLMTKNMRPLPVELLSDTTLPYRKVLEQSQWWVDRVKQGEDSDNVSGGMNDGAIKKQVAKT